MISTYPLKEIGQGMYEISEFQAVSMYLVEGSERSLLIDTGSGVGNLREFVEGMTDKPLTVFITHNHRDHMGNAALFDRITMSEEDTYVGPLIYPVDVRLKYANSLMRFFPDRKPWTEDDMFHFTEDDIPAVDFIHDGDVIDLGDRQLRAVHVPGHSPGSMALIEQQSGYLFCGDAVNGNVGLAVRKFDNFTPPSMEDALAALKRLWEMEFDHSRVYSGHIAPEGRQFGEPLPEDVFPKLMELMEQVIAGTCDIQEHYIANVNTYVAKAFLDGVSIEFQKDNVHGKNTFHVFKDIPVKSTY